MNTKRSHYIGPVTPAQSGTEKSTRSRSGKSSTTLLLGWVVSMIGIVIYFFVMSSGDQQSDLLTALIASGPLGWSALLVILIGIGLWFTGCIGLLKEAEDAGRED